MSRPDVVVIGGGIVGAACARSLALRSLTVTVLDNGTEAGVATGAAGGMLAPLAEIQREDPLLSFCVRARDHYHELAPELHEETGIDIGLWTEGIVQLAFSEDDATHLKGEIAWQRQQGYNADWLSLEDLREVCPGISREAVGALLAPEDGAVEPKHLHEALMKQALQKGATLSRGSRVEEIVIDGGRATGVRVGSETISAGAIVLAAGCWSSTINGLPRPVSVQPIRGQMLAYDWPKGEPHAIVYGGSGYVMRRGHEALAGSTMEHVGFDASTTEAGLQSVSDTVARIYPALAKTEPKRSWAGLRPVTPDGTPFLGADPQTDGLWYATGHGRNGILLAGMTGDLLGQMMSGEKVEYDLGPLDPGRFWRF